MSLQGKVALITGGGTGLGAAIAQRFVADGAKVVITGRRENKLEEMLSALPRERRVNAPGMSPIRTILNVWWKPPCLLTAGSKSWSTVREETIQDQLPMSVLRPGVIRLKSMRWRRL